MERFQPLLRRSQDKTAAGTPLYTADGYIGGEYVEIDTEDGESRSEVQMPLTANTRIIREDDDLLLVDRDETVRVESVRKAGRTLFLGVHRVSRR